MLRTGHLLAFTHTLCDAGAPVDQYLSRHGLPLHCERQDGYVPIARVWSFLDDIAHREDAMFGWRCGAAAGDRPLSGKLLNTINNAPSLYQALLRFTRLVNAEATHLQVALQGRGPHVLIQASYPGMGDIPGYAVAQSYQLEVILGIIRHFLGADWRPSEVGLEFAPTPGDISDFLPGTRIVTGQSCGYIVIPRDILYRSVGVAMPIELSDAATSIQTEFGFADSLGGMLSAYLHDGYPTARFAADLMDMSERTLERRLAQVKTTYGEVVDRVRFEAAKELLAQPDLQIGEISSALGFTDQRNFARMFRRISNLSPREYRNTVATL